jgi:hypothetical protein
MRAHHPLKLPPAIMRNTHRRKEKETDNPDRYPRLTRNPYSKPGQFSMKNQGQFWVEINSVLLSFRHLLSPS